MTMVNLVQTNESEVITSTREVRMGGVAEVTKWVHPETKRKAIQRARDRANAARWNLDIAVFLFGILTIAFILVFEGVNTWIIALVAVFGLAMVWLIGWRRARQVFGRFLDEELARYPDDWNQKRLPNS
ncbi:hypothetical protein ACFLUU_04000 [Chloroflexota bacterium]